MTGRIVYASFPSPIPIGGIRVLARHVELLREAGHDAVLWLPEAADRSPWFSADIPVCSGATLPLSADDLLVLPEVPVTPAADPAPGARKVILNQNHFYTYAAWPDDERYPGWDPDPTLWTISAEGLDVLTRLHPELNPRLVPDPVDVDLFVPGIRERPSIAWMPRKRPREAALLRRLLAADPRARGVELHEIASVPLEEVARILGRTTVFVSLCHTEGFGLPIAEALSAGCVVVGYGGGGGHDLFDAPGARAVPEQRPGLLADAALEAVGAPDAADLGTANRAWVLERWSPGVTVKALVEAVADARSRPGAASVATHPFSRLGELPDDFAISG